MRPHLLLPAAVVALGLLLPGTTAACPTPPPAVRDLDIPRFYGDAEGSRIDPIAAEKHKAAVAPLTAFLRQVVADTDKAVRARDGKAAACPLSWIAAWAKGDAWLGNMGTKQAEYERKWDLGGVALAYVKLKPYASAAQRKMVEPWLVRFADAAMAFQLDPARQRNNHLYWLGLGLAATALAADSPRHWDAARRIMHEAAGHIAADGTLPLELGRGARALHYHAFAVTPLIAMAEIAARRGEDWYALGNGALHRLVATTIAGLVEPERFAVITGTVQERPPGTGVGWLTLYGQRFPERLPGQLPGVSDRHRWLGGDVPLLMQAVGTVSRS